MENFAWPFAQVKTIPLSIQTSPEDGCRSVMFLLTFIIESHQDLSE
jgi:hypothetical protein